MTFVAAHGEAIARAGTPDWTEPTGLATLGMRTVHRALGDLRRGTPALLRLGEQIFIVVPAETLGAEGLAEFATVADGQFLLLLDAGRAERWDAPGSGRSNFAPDHGMAFRVTGAMLRPDLLRGMADPTAVQWFAGPPQVELPPPCTKAALELAKLARLLPAMLVARAGASAASADLLTVEAGAVTDYPAATARLVKAAEAQVPLDGAPETRLVSFRGPDGGIEHVAILVGHPEQVASQAIPTPAPLARIHSECFTGDLLGSLRCDCGPQLRVAVRRMAEEGAGVLLYLAQEGRGIGLANKLRAYALQDAGLDTLDANRALGWRADERDYAPAATMLRALEVRRVRLLTNNPQKLAALQAGGIAVERVSHLVAGNGVNDGYLATKAARFGHLGD